MTDSYGTDIASSMVLLIAIAAIVLSLVAIFASRQMQGPEILGAYEENADTEEDYKTFNASSSETVTSDIVSYLREHMYQKNASLHSLGGCIRPGMHTNCSQDSAVWGKLKIVLDRQRTWIRVRCRWFGGRVYDRYWYDPNQPFSLYP